MTTPLRGLRVALHEALDASALLVGAWQQNDVVRLVYAFPSLRLATLAHWRDEAEFSWNGHDVVAFEASKFARLLLKSHGGTLLTCATTPWIDPEGLLDASASVAQGMWTADARSWVARAAQQVPTGAHAMSPAERFPAVNGWLTNVRRAADRSNPNPA